MNTSTVKIILCFLLIIPIMANAQSNDIQTWIERIGRQYAPDSRTAVYTVSSELLNDSIHILKGKCDNRQAVETLLRTLDTAGISYINAIKLLPDRRLGEKTRGIVTVCCAHLRSEPRHSAEMVSQAILGTPLLILEEQKGWYRVQTPDNYQLDNRKFDLRKNYCRVDRMEKCHPICLYRTARLCICFRR